MKKHPPLLSREQTCSLQIAWLMQIEMASIGSKVGFLFDHQTFPDWCTRRRDRISVSSHDTTVIKLPKTEWVCPTWKNHRVSLQRDQLAIQALCSYVFMRCHCYYCHIIEWVNSNKAQSCTYKRLPGVRLLVTLLVYRQKNKVEVEYPTHAGHGAQGLHIKDCHKRPEQEL